MDQLRSIGRGRSIGLTRHRALVLGTTLMLATALAGCVGASVPLLTGRGVLGPPSETVGCYTNYASGLLTVDPTYGTFINDNVYKLPVMWPPGYTARKAGSEVEVLDTNGQVVARTGNRYQIEGGQSGEKPGAFIACGYVLPK